MYHIKRIINTFSYITAGSSLVAALFVSVFYPDTEFHITLIWQIITISVVCALGNLIFYLKKIMNRKEMIGRIIIHYFYINCVVFGGGYLWNWLTPGLLPEFLVMLLLVGLVYVIITIVTFRQEEKIAADLNRRLREQFPNQEDAD